MSSCVRPGVREMRARFLRPVSALIRLDLPTFERPAKAISTPFMTGNEAGEPAAATNCQSPAKSLRPASISARVNSAEDMKLVMPGLVPGIPVRRAQYHYKRDRRDKPGDDNNDSRSSSFTAAASS
jgi:hypothetical protein